MFEEDFSVLVNMDDTILSESSDSKEDIGVIEGGVKIQNLSVLFGEVDLGRFALEKH